MLATSLAWSTLSRSAPTALYEALARGFANLLEVGAVGDLGAARRRSPSWSSRSRSRTRSACTISTRGSNRTAAQRQR